MSEPHEIAETYFRRVEQIEELTGQELQGRLQSPYWEDGVPASVVLAAAAQAGAGEREELPISFERKLSGRTRAELVISAAQLDRDVLEQLRKAGQTSGMDRAAASRARRTQVLAVVETCAELVQGVASGELQMPVTEDAQIRELAALALAITPEAERDLSVLPDALEAAVAALTEV